MNKRKGDVSQRRIIFIDKPQGYFAFFIDMLCGIHGDGKKGLVFSCKGCKFERRSGEMAELQGKRHPVADKLIMIAQALHVLSARHIGRQIGAMHLAG